MRTDWFFNAFATRFGTGATIAVLLAIGVAGSIYLRASISDVERQGAIQHNENLREAIFALGDVHRLSYVLQRAASNTPVTRNTISEFAEALETLYVRQFAIQRDRASGVRNAEAAAAAATLADIIQAGEAFTLTTATIPETELTAFLKMAEAARTVLVSYIEGIREDHNVVLQYQSDTLSLLVRALEVTMVVMGVIGVSAILLLHREVVGRRQREAAERKADYLAYNDPMTALPNRQRFNDTLKDLMDRRMTMAMLFLDLDDFKGINDTYGHGFGDVVLQQVAARLKIAVDAYAGTAARLGGDEFGALLPTDNVRKLECLCNDILEKAAEPITSEGVTIQAGVSIGVATSTEVRNATAASPEAMSRSADFALYEAKAAGRGTYRIYDRALDQRYLAHRSLLDAIPAALENQEFFVAYQPKVELGSNTIYGFEALIRWEKDGEVISPAQFLPVAEESRLITQLDLMVLADSTRQTSEWNAEFGTSLSVSVNLSALHFDDFSIIDEVKFALARANLPPQLLTLELTETILLEDWDKVQDILAELRALGCRISLDDFGTGYSSLAYLRRIEADELKIDRSFVIDIEESQETAFILDAVVDIAKSLGMSIVVEGVESDAQAKIVESFGCDRGQGFLFGKPMPADEAYGRLATSNGVAVGVQRHATTGTHG